MLRFALPLLSAFARAAALCADDPWTPLEVNDTTVTERIDGWNHRHVPDLTTSDDAKVGQRSIVGAFGFTHSISISAGDAASWNLTGYEELIFWAKADRPNDNLLVMLIGRDLQNRRDAAVRVTTEWQEYRLPLTEESFPRLVGEFDFTRARSLAFYNNQGVETRIWLDGLEFAGLREPQPVVDPAAVPPAEGDPNRMPVLPTDPSPHIEQARAEWHQVRSAYHLPPAAFNPRNSFTEALVDFSRTGDWVVRVADATVQASLSMDQPLRGVPNLKVDISPTSETARVSLFPPEPIRIEKAFDIIECWAYGNAAGARIAFHIRRPDGGLLVVGSNCAESLSGVTWHSMSEYWNLIRIVLPGRVQAGAQLLGIHLDPNAPKGYEAPTYPIHLDQLRVVDFAEQMSRPAPRFEHVGRVVDGFPTSPDGACPKTTEPVETSVRKVGDAYRFTYSTAPGAEVTYAYTPATGTLSDLSIRPRGKDAFQPAAGSGPVFEFGDREYTVGAESAVGARLVSERLENGVLEVTWRYATDAGQQDVTYQFSMKGKTLRIEATSTERSVREWRFGEAHGVRDARVVEVPYMLYSPNVLLTDGLFCSYYADFYFSNASMLPYGGENSVTGDVAKYNWRQDHHYSYYKRTDGLRYPLHEVFYITASEDFDDCLLTVSNPPSPMRSTLKKRLYRMVLASVPGIFKRTRDFVDLADGYGMNDYYFLFHAPLFFKRHGADEAFPGDLHVSRVHEAEGGDRGLAELFAYMREKGIAPGYYDGYPGRDATSANFDCDWTSYRPDGSWERMWRAPALKPWAFPELANTLYRQRAEMYGPRVSYQDGITAWIITHMNDYDHRFEDSGTLRGTMRALATGWQRVREYVDGPVFSEGRGSEFYTTGLNDGDYAKIKGYWDDKPCDEDGIELLVDFRLKKLGPLASPVSVNIGYAGFAATNKIGYESYYANEESYGFFHHFLATQIAFATIGMLEPYWPIWDGPATQFDKTMTSYFMIRQLQERYIMEPVGEVRYFDGHELLGTSDALRADVVRGNMVFIRYENGLEVYVNLNWEGRHWSVTHGETTYDLPPGGWLASQGADFLEFSAVTDGHRVDYVNSPDYVYLDGHGVASHVGDVETVDQTIVWKTGPHAGQVLKWPK